MLSAGEDHDTRERQRKAFEALVALEFDIGVYAGIARVVATGLGCRGAGIARLSADGQSLTALGLWLDGAVCPDFAPLPPSLAALPEPLALRFSASPHVRLVRLPPPFDGRRSAIALPLRDDGDQPLGVLFAVGDRFREDDPDELALLKVAAARASAELMREASAERYRESEARMRFALEAGALGMWEWDVDTDTYVINDRWAAIRGFAPHEISPSFSDWHPDDEARLRPLVAAVMSGQIDSYEVDYRTGDRRGEWRWINARSKVITRGPDGRPLRIIGVQTDIHERRLAEEAARANVQWLELAVDATEMGLWDWRAAGDQMHWSPRCARMLGYRLDELPQTAKAWIALNHPEDQPEAARQFCSHIRGRTPQIRVEIRCRARDGHWVWILSTGQVIERDVHGRAVRAVGTHLDISQLKNAELALRESEARLRTIVDNSPIGIFLADAAGAVVYCNPVILSLRESDEREDGIYTWQQFLHPDDRARVVQSWQAFVHSPLGIYECEWRAVRPSGSSVRVRVRSAAIREQDRVLGFAGTVEDITIQQRERALEWQLQQAQKVEAIGTLTGGIAHDFNNSLATILGFASLALSRPLEDRKLGEYLDTIVRAGEHSRDLVRKLLEFSRSTPAGDVIALDARPRILDAVHMLKAVIPTTIRIDTALDPDTPPVQIDATDLHQVVLNLVLNGRDAIDSHGEIRVSLGLTRVPHALCAACHREFDGSWVELAVADSGGGIAAADLPRIFDPFYSTKEVGHGTGMGLSVIHGIVHRAGGHLIVDSTPGKGTTMRVLLRAGAATAAERYAPFIARNPVTADGPQAHVLVVDDEPTIVRFLCEWLETEGCVGQGFTDPLAARAWAEQADVDFDVLITDQTMPRMTGLELVAALRAQRPQLPVIVCTGLADRVSVAEANALGIAQLCLKPVSLPELQQALQRAMRTPAP